MLLRKRQSKIQLKLASHRRAQTVVKLAQVQAASVVLDVARVEVISNVENDNAGSRALIEDWNFEALEDGCVERDEGRKASGLIAGADELEPFVDDGKWETGANLECWRDRQIERTLHFSVGQEAMRHIERQRPVLVRPNHQSGKISEEIICRVQVAARPGPDK